jgi:23S rRNA (uracil1939-C5)-methyltransferase
MAGRTLENHMAKQKHIIPVRPHDKIELTVENQGSSGDGISKHKGYTLFVPGGIPGDLVFAEVMKITPRFGVTRIIEQRSPSPDRIKAPCPVFIQCGGCKLQDLKYDKQMEFKVNVVKDALKHIGKIESSSIRSIPSEKTYKYRNKGSFAIQKQGGFLRMGFFKQGSHDVVSTERCGILHDPINDAKEYIRELLIKHQVSIYDEKKHLGLFRELVIRHSQTTNQLLVGLVTTSGDFSEEFLKELTNKDSCIKLNISGIVQNINSQKTNVILGKETRVIWGKGELNEQLGKLNFNLSLTSFFQVHPEQTIRLLEIIGEWAQNTTGRILDAFCGIGAISLWLGQSGLRVIGIEELPQAVLDARASAKKNSIDSCSFIAGKVEDHIRKFKGQDIEIIILDPPRKGCSEKVITAVSEIMPKKVIYVSCNPSTLARDLARLENYTIEDIIVIDLFPQTKHVETAVLLTSKKS